MAYSEKKFRSLVLKKQFKEIFTLAHNLEQQWQSGALRVELKADLLNYLSWLNHQSQSLADFKQAMENPDLSIREFLIFVVPLQREYYSELYIDDLLVTQKDGDLSSKKQHHGRDIVLVLENIRSAFNVGSLIRTVEFYGLKKIYLCGYTPGIDDAKVLRTSLGAEKLINFITFTKTISALDELKNQGYKVLALETSEKSTSIGACKFNSSVALVLGNERYGLDYQTIKASDEVVSLPSYGLKNSLNVTVAGAIACHHFVHLA